MIKKLLFFALPLAALMFTFNGYTLAVEKTAPCDPCSKISNTCSPCTRMEKDRALLVEKGKQLWNDKKLGTSEMSCISCHADHENLNLDKVVIYPNYMTMPDNVLSLKKMINYCMVNPMQTASLSLDSPEMEAIAAYYSEYIKSYKGARKFCNYCSNKGD